MQPGLRVADLGLDPGGPPGDLRLPSQRGELTADLGEQVAEPGEVALGGVELAEPFSLRLRCLRTPAASSMKPRRSSGVACRIVQLALADDHVHLAADAGVGEQLLDVEQPAGAPLMAYSDPPLRNMVRLIVTSVYSIGSAPSLLSMVSEHLGAAQRRAAGGAGEDDVLHLAAAQGLAPCSPITHASASTTLDLPEPLGPTMQVIPGLELQASTTRRT